MKRRGISRMKKLFAGVITLVLGFTCAMPSSLAASFNEEKGKKAIELDEVLVKSNTSVETLTLEGVSYELTTETTGNDVKVTIKSELGIETVEYDADTESMIINGESLSQDLQSQFNDLSEMFKEENTYSPYMDVDPEGGGTEWTWKFSKNFQFAVKGLTALAASTALIIYLGTLDDKFKKVTNVAIPMASAVASVYLMITTDYMYITFKKWTKPHPQFPKTLTRAWWWIDFYSSPSRTNVTKRISWDTDY